MTLFEEMFAAGRGLIALLLGQRTAPNYYDLTLSGLVGSVAVFLIATGLHAYLPVLFNIPSDLHPWQTFLMLISLYAMQLGFAAILLNWLRRLDGLVPYLVASNWATFFVTLINISLALANIGGGFTLLLVLVAVIVIEINIARLIVTLTPGQIAMFLVAQIVGVLLGAIVVGMIIGPEITVQ